MKKTLLCEATQSLVLMSLDGSEMRAGELRELPADFARPLINSGLLKEVKHDNRIIDSPDSDSTGSSTDLDSA